MLQYPVLLGKGACKRVYKGKGHHPPIISYHSSMLSQHTHLTTSPIPAAAAFDQQEGLEVRGQEVATPMSPCNHLRQGAPQWGVHSSSPTYQSSGSSGSSSTRGRVLAEMACLRVLV